MGIALWEITRPCSTVLWCLQGAACKWGQVPWPTCVIWNQDRVFGRYWGQSSPTGEEGWWQSSPKVLKAAGGYESGQRKHQLYKWNHRWNKTRRKVEWDIKRFVQNTYSDGAKTFWINRINRKWRCHECLFVGQWRSLKDLQKIPCN